MHKQLHLIIMVIFLGFTSLKAQTTLLDQSLLTEASFSTFTPVSVTGVQSWEFSSMYGAVCSGYDGNSVANEDWLISPALNLTDTDNVKLTFRHTRGNGALVNVGVAEGWYKVFVSANFTGDPITTEWVELSFNQTLPAAWQFVSSGELIIPESAKSESTRFAFRYISSDTQNAIWEIKNVKVTGEPQATNPNAGLFKITNWNTEWLGCTQFGPTNESLQLSNVANAMLSMNSDIYCIQEVSSTVANPTIASLVSIMGSDQWEGQLVPTTTGDCDQRQGIIFKKSKVQFVNATQLSSGPNAQGNSYYYNWASGRYPAVYNVNFVSGSTLVPMTLVNIHAKAEDGNAMSYTRRMGGSEGLKTILDGASYNSKNLMIIGDFNDYLDGTTSTACACIDSPFKNFIDDSGNYDGITRNITDENVTWGMHPLIENMLISNELSDNYVSNSTAQQVAVAQNISGYMSTTSNHYPVSASFQFDVLGTQDYSVTENQWLLYPNPVKNELTLNSEGFESNVTAEIYDLTGRKMSCEIIDKNTVNVVALPTGVYILKVANRSCRFVKQ